MAAKNTEDAPKKEKKARGPYQPHHLVYAGFAIVLLLVVLFLFAVLNISDVWDQNAGAAISLFSAGLAAVVTAWLIDALHCRSRNAQREQSITAVYSRLKFGLASLADAYSQLLVGYNAAEANSSHLWTEWADALLAQLNHMSSPGREIEINKVAKDLAKWIQLPLPAAEVLDYDGPVLITLGLWSELQVNDITVLTAELKRAFDTLMSGQPAAQLDKMRELRNVVSSYLENHSVPSMKALNTIAHEPKKLYYLSAKR